MQLNTVHQTDRIIQVELIGQLDAIGVEEIDKEFSELARTLDHHVLLVVTRMPYVASLGVAMMISAEQLLRKRGLRIVMAGPQPDVAKLMKQLRINDMIPMFDSIEEAVAFLSPADPS